MSAEYKETGAYLGVPGSFPRSTGLWGWNQKQCPSWKAITQAPFPGLLPGKTLTSQLPQRHDETKSLLDPKFLDSGCLPGGGHTSSLGSLASSHGHGSGTHRPWYSKAI